ncbi:DUF1638 domain-containing protein [Neomoorella thermoacetica]|uniref:DUF1638 domain-containing protein n=1 Tax=Neomoorella thermoacetica TaxID=1525 RepID=UPI0008FB37D6|nr:DUF1638 domain-containing protein [Moorella thermoacetica]APC08482.1 hypothetical protein MTJW_13230 [Moorella thermoacetica]OIQ56458.1 hypothetical protein MORE_03240 [Moorella thermoacetica]
MRSLIIACRVMEDELLSLATGREDLLFLDQGLHRSPERLRQALQEAINAANDYDLILLGYGLCGGALDGLRTGSCPVIIPKVDDCIPLLLGSVAARARWPTGTYFLSSGWLAGEENMVREYQRCLERYGEERGRWILKQLYCHYQNVVFIKTDFGQGTCSAGVDRQVKPASAASSRLLHPAALAMARQLAANLGLTYEVYQGNSLYLQRLIQGPWEDDFLKVEPRQEISIRVFRNPEAGEK